MGFFETAGWAFRVVRRVVAPLQSRRYSNDLVPRALGTEFRNYHARVSELSTMAVQAPSGLSVTEDPVLAVTKAVMELNGGEGRGVYPCSMAVPREVWEQRAREQEVEILKILRYAEEMPAEQAALMKAHAAQEYTQITFGWRFDASEFHQKAIPIAKDALELVRGAAAIGDEDKLFCLNTIASVAGRMNDHDTAYGAYELMLPLARKSDVNDSALVMAALLSNYAHEARCIGDAKLEKQLRKEAAQLWRKTNADEGEQFVIG